MSFLMGMFSILSLLFFVAAFVGLISPKLVLFKWGKNFTRFRTFMLFITLFFLCVIVNSAAVSHYAKRMESEELAQQDKIKAEQAAREKAEQDKIIADFSVKKAEILLNLESLISQKQFDLAEKGITKYDIKPLQSDLSDVKRHLQKAVLDEKTKNTPENDIEASLKIYSDLARIEPENQIYKEKLAHYKAEVEEKEKEEKERKRKEVIKNLEKQLKEVPVSEVSENLKLYKELLKLAPDDSLYKNKFDYYQAKAEELEQEKRREILKASSHLELLNWQWDSRYGYAVVEGEVRNISGKKLENVEAVVTWYSKNDEMITSRSSLIEYRPLLSEQTSPFKVMVTFNPAMEKAVIEFKHLMGGKIPTYSKK